MAKKKVLLKLENSLHEDIKKEAKREKAYLNGFYEEVIRLGFEMKKNLSQNLSLNKNNK